MRELPKTDDNQGDGEADITISEFQEIKIFEKIKYPNGVEEEREIAYFGRRRKGPSYVNVVRTVVSLGILTIAAVYTGQLEVLVDYFFRK